MFSPACRVIYSLRNAPQTAELKVVRMTGLDEDERHALASHFVSWYGKRLADEVLQLIARSEPAASPRYLSALLNELRIFGNHEALVERVKWYLQASTLSELYELLLARMEADYETLRPRLVGEAVSLIWASRRGISQEDLLSLLGTSAGPLMVELWVPIRIALGDGLIEHINRVQFGNEDIREAVRRRYVPCPEDAVPYHRKLALKLLVVGEARTKRLKSGVIIHDDPGLEDEMLWQLNRGQLWNELAHFLSLLGWLVPVWHGHEEDILEYWKGIEEHTTIRTSEVYRPIMEDPIRYRSWPDAFVIVAEVLVRMGHEGMVRQAVDQLDDEDVNDESWSNAETAEIVVPSLRCRGLQALGDWEGAISVLEQQARAFSADEKPVLYELALRRQGDLFVEHGQFQDALDRYREGEVICRSHSLRNSLLKIYSRRLSL